MQRVSRISKTKRTFNAIKYVVGGGINHLFIGKIVNLFAKIKVRFRFFNKISRLFVLLASQSLYRYKQSFSMISLAMYLMISALAVSITLGAIAIVDNAKIARTIDEIEYYQKANSEFIVTYSTLPGLVPHSECLRFADFNDVCRNQNDLNLTTSENVYKSTTNDCRHDMGCIIETNGKAGNEDIMRNFLLPMRYLKTAGLIDTIIIGLETELDENEDYSTKVWAKSRVDKELYINIYNYYNPTRNTSKPFLFTGQTIFGHTINSDASFDHYNKLAKSNNQYLLYLKKSETPRGAIPSKIAHKIDKKFDDGKPMTGRLTTFSTSTFSDNFESSEYAGCITAEPNNKDNLDDISYNISKNSGYCNIAYQLQNFSSAVIENDKTISLNDTKYENGTRYKTYSDGTVIQDDKIDETTLQGYEVEYTYSDGSTKTMKPTCSCNQETRILSCNYEDGTNRSFYPLGDVCTYDDATGKQTCTYETGTQCDVELTQTDFQNNCTVENSIMTCNYVNKGAIPETKTYTTTKKDCASNLKGVTCEAGTAYYCDTFNDKIVDCQAYAYNQLCTSDSGTCTTGDAYSCTTLNGTIKSGSCKAISYKYCKTGMTDTSTTNCSATPTDTSYTNYCKFIDTAKQSCETKTVSNRYCTATTTAYNSCHTSPSSTSEKYYCPFVGDIHAGNCQTKTTSNRYCTATTTAYNSCHTSPQSTSEKYYCPFVGDIHAGSCEDKSHYRYCTYTSKLMGFENGKPVHSFNCNDFQDCITDAQFKDDPVGHLSGRTLALFIGTTGMSCINTNDSDLKIDYKMCPSYNSNASQCMKGSTPSEINEAEKKGFYHRCMLSANDGSILFCSRTGYCTSQLNSGITFNTSQCRNDWKEFNTGAQYFKCQFINNKSVSCSDRCNKTGSTSATCYPI